MKRIRKPMGVQIAQKGENQFDISFNSFTAGMVMATVNALKNYPTSAVAQDVLAFLQAAIDRNQVLKEKLGT